MRPHQPRVSARTVFERRAERPGRPGCRSLTSPRFPSHSTTDRRLETGSPDHDLPPRAACRVSTVRNRTMPGVGAQCRRSARQTEGVSHQRCFRRGAARPIRSPWPTDREGIADQMPNNHSVPPPTAGPPNGKDAGGSGAYLELLAVHPACDRPRELSGLGVSDPGGALACGAQRAREDPAGTQQGSRPMNPSSLVCASASPGTSTLGP
jgi:hypothetical protein